MVGRIPAQQPWREKKTVREFTVVALLRAAKAVLSTSKDHSMGKPTPALVNAVMEIIRATESTHTRSNGMLLLVEMASGDAELIVDSLPANAHDGWEL